MIKYKDTILEEFFIDPVTAIITNSKGEIQKTYINKGRPCFKCHGVHEWQVHTHIGYKEGYDIHHLDENKMNNSLSNLVYLTHSEHMKIHMEGKNHPFYGKHHSEEAKQKISKAMKNMSDETKKKMSKSHKGKTLSEETKIKLKGKNTWTSNTIWVNNGVISKRAKCDEIPEGFVRGRLKCKK